VLVGEASTVVNLDDIMNQSVSISNLVFDRGVFTYTDASKNPVNLIEVIDNVSIFLPMRACSGGKFVVSTAGGA